MLQTFFIDSYLFQLFLGFILFDAVGEGKGICRYGDGIRSGQARELKLKEWGCSSHRCSLLLNQNILLFNRYGISGIPSSKGESRQDNDDRTSPQTNYRCFNWHLASWPVLTENTAFLGLLPWHIPSKFLFLSKRLWSIYWQLHI